MLTRVRDLASLKERDLVVHALHQRRDRGGSVRVFLQSRAHERNQGEHAGVEVEQDDGLVLELVSSSVASRSAFTVKPTRIERRIARPTAMAVPSLIRL